LSLTPKLGKRGRFAKVSCFEFIHNITQFFGLVKMRLDLEKTRGRLKGTIRRLPQYDLPDLPQYHLPELQGRRDRRRL
jgi:hypothetical protein